MSETAFGRIAARLRTPQELIRPIALAAHGRLRAVGFVDVMIAAHAYTNRLTVLHYDSDFSDHIAASVPGFRHQWVVPRGSL